MNDFDTIDGLELAIHGSRQSFTYPLDDREDFAGPSGILAHLKGRTYEDYLMASAMLRLAQSGEIHWGADMAGDQRSMMDELDKAGFIESRRDSSRGYDAFHLVATPRGKRAFEELEQSDFVELAMMNAYDNDTSFGCF